MKNIKRNNDLKEFEWNFARNCVKHGFFFQNDSVENILICPRTKLASHCLSELFPIYQNKHWTIRRRDDHIVVQSSHCNISKIDGFLVFDHEDSLAVQGMNHFGEGTEFQISLHFVMNTSFKFLSGL